MKRLVIGVSGASGLAYTARVLRWLAQEGRELGVETHVVFSKPGRLVWAHEVGTDPRDYGLPMWGSQDFTAPFASGSAGFDAMAVVPCSAGCLGRIAHGLSTDLVCRAGDVMLKERRRLVLLLREAPYSLPMIRNMEAVTLAGAVVLPASPGFYMRPRSLEDLVDGMAARVLDLLGLPNTVAGRWDGMHPAAEEEG